VSGSAVSAKVRLGFVWREAGAVRNARPNRGQAAPTWKRPKWGERRRSLPFQNGWLLHGRLALGKHSTEFVT